MTDTTKERDLEVAIDSLKHSCLRLNKYQHRATVDIEDVELVLTKLEAERQRADANEPVRCEGVPQHFHDMIDLQETIDELRAELAALKGDQVPVAWLNQHGPFGGVVTMSPTMANSWEMRGDDVTPLFTAPQKPVVCLKSGYLHKSEVIYAIEAAGCVVSFSDERLMQDMSGIVKDGE